MDREVIPAGASTTTLTPTLRFPLFRLFPDAGLLVIPPPFELPEEPFSR